LIIFPVESIVLFVRDALVLIHQNFVPIIQFFVSSYRVLFEAAVCASDKSLKLLKGIDERPEKFLFMSNTEYCVKTKPKENTTKKILFHKIDLCKIFGEAGSLCVPGRWRHNAGMSAGSCHRRSINISPNTNYFLSQIFIRLYSLTAKNQLP
jgi:hypothetical protein